MFNSQIKKSSTNVDDNMIPMINIVFLLLIFFMIAGQISALDEQNIDAILTQETTPAAELELTLVVTQTGKIYFQNQLVDFDHLADALAQHSAEHTKIAVILDKHLLALHLQPILKTVQNAGFNVVNLLTQQGAQ